MAQKKKASEKAASASKSAEKVTRITAKDTRASKQAPEKTKTKTATKQVAADKKVTDKTPKAKRESRGNLFTYVKGAWQELRQVRWPNRRTTWGLTLAVILFTVFFVGLIVLLDYLFQLLFDRILG